MTQTDSNFAAGKSVPFAWCGWQLSLPATWEPVKLEGDESKGFVLFGDLERPRLGVRWSTPPARRRTDPDQLSRQSLLGEIGQLATDEATPDQPEAGLWRGGLLYQEPDPPGRDVWVGVSGESGRILELVYHLRRRDRVLKDRLLPAIRDAAEGQARRWAIYDLSVDVPADYKLQTQKFAAGDLRLNFAAPRHWLVVRQVRPAKLALARRPIEDWCKYFAYEINRFFRKAGAPQPTTMPTGDGEATGLRQEMQLRRRYRWIWSLPRRMTTLALREEASNRLLLVRASESEVLDDVVRSTCLIRRGEAV